MSDKAGLKWKGYHVPLSEKGEEAKDEERRFAKEKKVFVRGWTGTTWPGKKCGHPYTVDGSKLVT